MSDPLRKNHRLTRTCCGIVHGFHRDDMVKSILAKRPEEEGRWFLSGEPAALGQLVKIQVILDDAWAILTGPITKVSDASVDAEVSLATFDVDLPWGPYSITLASNDATKHPWILTRVELTKGEEDTFSSWSERTG